MPQAVIWVLALAGAAALVGVMVWHAGRVERSAVAAAARVLPDHVREGLLHLFRGRVRGVPLTLRLVQRMGEAQPHAGLWSEVELPAIEGVALELRPQDPIEGMLVAQGLARDAAAGAPAFDAAFVVEMAPAALAPTVFDAELQRRLMELQPVRVLRSEGGALRLVRRHWDEARFGPLVETAALLAVRLREALGADAASAWERKRERSEERAALERVRSARAAWTLRTVALVVAGLLLILVLRLLAS
jgi:hypothetical protein